MLLRRESCFEVKGSTLYCILYCVVFKTLCVFSTVYVSGRNKIELDLPKWTCQTWLSPEKENIWWAAVERRKMARWCQGSEVRLGQLVGVHWRGSVNSNDLCMQQKSAQQHLWMRNLEAMTVVWTHSLAILLGSCDSRAVPNKEASDCTTYIAFSVVPIKSVGIAVNMNKEPTRQWFFHFTVLAIKWL